MLQSKSRCLKCDKGHNMSIYPNRKIEISTNAAGIKDKEHNYILLQTAAANVSSSENDDYKQFHILLDSGSQLSYISPKAS